MATIYLAGTGATNITATPSDANDGLTIGAPKATLAAAQTAAGVGGTVIADGVFLTSANAYFTMASLANQTINSYATDSAIFRTDPAATSVSRVFHVPAAATGLTLGEIVLDANSKAAGCITFDSAADVNSTVFNNTLVKGFTNIGINGAARLRASSGTLRFEASGAATRGFYSTPSNADTFSFSGGSTTVSGISGSFKGYEFAPTVTGVSATVTGVANSGTGDGSATSEFFGTKMTGCSTAISTDHTYAMSNFVKGATVQFPIHATLAVTKLRVTGLSGYMSPTLVTSSMYLAQIGDDLATSTPNFSDVVVSGNDLSGANHGYLIGCVNGARVFGNRAKQIKYGVVSKGSDTGNFIEGNIVEECTDYALYSKGSVGDKITGNTVVLSSGYNCVPEFANKDDVSLIETSNATFANNIIYCKTGATITKLAWATTGSTVGVTFSHNNYFAVDNNIPATAFQFGATSYSLADWITNVESTALGVDPLFVAANDANYALATGSPMWRAGDATAKAKDYRGRRRPTPPSIGAYEPSSGDPIQLARTARA